MPTDKARITIDLTPELRRELKAVAARADMTMREFVTESVRRDLERVRRGAAENGPAIKQARRAAAHTPAVDRAGEQLAEAASVAAVNEAQQRAIRQLTDPVREQLAAFAEQAAGPFGRVSSRQSSPPRPGCGTSWPRWARRDSSGRPPSSSSNSTGPR
jgi:hypothetical protein